MLLLDLPAELLRHILHLLDPESFYVCLRTSRLFRAHALNSTSLLLDQIANMPGQRWLKRETARDPSLLVKEFGKRAAHNLMHGGSGAADLQIWKSSTKHVDYSNSTIVPCTGDFEVLEHERLMFLEVQTVDATLKVYTIELNGKSSYTPRLKHVISPQAWSLNRHNEDHQSGCEVLRISTFRPLGDEDSPDLPHVAVLYQAKHATSKDIWRQVVKYKLDPNFGPIVLNTLDIRGTQSETVKAFAVSACGLPIILYKSYASWPRHRIVTYHTTRDECTLDKTTNEDVQDISSSIWNHERIGHMTVHGKHIHLYPTTFPIPAWTIPRYTDFTQRIERRDNHLPDIVEVFPKQSLGIPFASHHHHNIREKDLNDGEKTCVNTILQLMISREEPYAAASRTGAYLLKALHYPNSCKYINLDKDYHNLHHVYVAYLAGVPLGNLSSLGLRIAISPCKHRIAIASWKTVKIWAMDARAFLEPEYGLGEGTDAGVPGDYAYIEGCGWQYYAKCDFWRECVVLEPVELQSAGVVYQLEFREEDELWGWTESGLCKWSFGVCADKRRMVSVLE